MKSVMGWWFCVNNKLPHGDDRKVEIGKTHIIKGEIIPCRKGEAQENLREWLEMNDEK